MCHPALVIIFRGVLIRSGTVAAKEAIQKALPSREYFTMNTRHFKMESVKIVKGSRIG